MLFVFRIFANAGESFQPDRSPPDKVAGTYAHAGLRFQSSRRGILPSQPVGNDTSVEKREEEEQGVRNAHVVLYQEPSYIDVR